jgi:hypothetical protein
MPDLAREIVVLSVSVGEDENEYEVSGDEVEERVAAMISLFTRSRESEINIRAHRVKRRGIGNGHG